MDKIVAKIIAFVKANLYAVAAGALAYFLVGLKFPPETSYYPFVVGVVVFGIALQVIRK